LAAGEQVVRELLILLVVVAVTVVIWYARRHRPTVPAHGESHGQLPPAIKAAPTNMTTEGASAPPSETGPPTSVPGAAEKGAGLFQDAAAATAGVPYVRAADRIEDMAAELSEAGRDAERAAERQANRVTLALTAIQAAAAVDGGAVPGDGSVRCPPRYPVKGDLRTMQYLNPGEPAYDQAVPDVCFESVAAAEAAELTENGGERRI
jgi:hypothetical protein